MTHASVIKDLKAQADPEKASFLSRYFKTGPGEYGEHDVFLGLTVPQVRKVAAGYTDLPLDEAEELLRSKIHEQRLAALIILVGQYRRGDAPTRKAIYGFYLANTKWINNWDLVDSSAEYIVGPQLEVEGDAALETLSHSDNLWERRIAMLACFDGIKKGRPERALRIAETLLHDQHDLIQKAVGWMLREVGKRCGDELLVSWLKDADRYKDMPRTALRYAIERLPETSRKAFLTGGY